MEDVLHSLKSAHLLKRWASPNMETGTSQALTITQRGHKTHPSAPSRQFQVSQTEGILTLITLDLDLLLQKKIANSFWEHKFVKSVLTCDY
jgi:hypothetical protein